MTEEEQKAIEELKKDLDIEIKECSSSNDYRHLSGLYLNGNVETILNLISKLQADIEIKDKVIDLIIDDFQTEGYFKKMTYEQVKKYYDNRNELKQEINTLPLNLDLTAK